MNINKAIQKLGIAAECKNMDLATAKTEQADYYMGSPEIMEQLEDGNRKVIKLINLMDHDAIEEHLKAMV